jgi:hypothetical protein
VKRQQVSIWTGGCSDRAAACQGMADTLPFLPAPAPLRRAALIVYQWGETRFKIAATACSVRTTLWGSEQTTWLHCKARQTAAITFDEPNGLFTVLFPAQYVTTIKPGPTFRLGQSGQAEDIVGLFPPNQPAPADALQLSEVERVLTELLAPERN